MSTWGTGVFENDAVTEWLDELAGDIEVVQDALDTSGEIALAAAEVVAAMCEVPLRSLPRQVREFVRRHKTCPPGVLEQASEAVARIFDESDLRDRWEESDDFDEWSDEVSDLISRLADALASSHAA